MASVPSDVASDLRYGRLKSVYLLYGEEVYLRDRAAKAIVDACLSPDTLDFNYAMFRAGESDIASVVAALMSAPAFADRRVVALRGFDELSAEEQRSLAGALRTMPRTTIAVITAQCVDERTSACKAVAEVGRVVRYRYMYESEAAAWLTRHARENGVDLSREARDYLVRTVGTSAARLAEALERARNYAGAAAGTPSSNGGVAEAPCDGPRALQKVTLEDVLAASTGEPALGIFDLVDAVGERNAGKAIAALRLLLGFGEPQGRILSMIARQVRLILKAKVMHGEGATIKRIADATHLTESMARKYIEQGTNFEAAELEDAFHALAGADDNIKTSTAPEGAILEELVLRLCGHDRAGSAPGARTC